MAIAKFNTGASTGGDVGSGSGDGFITFLLIAAAAALVYFATTTRKPEVSEEKEKKDA